jgi:predicted DNA-binding protein YlxM (UPF0122 family)
VAKRLAEENDAAHKSVEEQIKKMRQDFEGYQKKKLEECNKLVTGAESSERI